MDSDRELGLHQGIWDTSTWTERAALHGHSEEVATCAVAPDGAWMATTSYDDTVRVWDTTTWQPRQRLTGHAGAVVACATGPDGTWLATGSWDNTARIWDTRRPDRHPHTTSSSPDDAVTVCAAAAAGRGWRRAAAPEPSGCGTSRPASSCTP